MNEETKVLDKKKEYMINVQGIVNSYKGKTKGKRYTIGLDAKNPRSALFLKQAQMFTQHKTLKRTDFVVFYDDTILKTGNRGFAITMDEIITNVSGAFRILPFLSMEALPELVKGLKRDVFRFQMEDQSYDIKVRQGLENNQVVFDCMKLFFNYSREIKRELEEDDA